MNKREYRQANKDWLEAKAKEDGVKALSKGVYYKVINILLKQKVLPPVFFLNQIRNGDYLSKP